MTGPPRELSVDLLDVGVELLADSRGVGAVPIRDGDRSMLPTLTAGQRVAVDLRSRGGRRGEILLFRQNDYLVVHRMLGRARFPDGSEALRTRGDAGPGLDPPVAPCSVKGRVIAAQEPDGGWRRFTGTRARSYGLALAWHGLFWSAVGRAAQTFGRDAPLHRGVLALDRGLVRLCHALLFRSCHPRTTGPPGEDR